MTLTPSPANCSPDYFRVGSAVINDLPDGTHTVFIQGQTTIGNIKRAIDANVTFTINTQHAPTPTVPEFSALVILPLFVAAPVIIAIIARKKSLLKATYK
ncbi:MAG: hypothetical protein ACQCN3_01955 [Candidatus Bathyarchaeia archaeon]|jgi:hypothetical protein